MITSVFDASLTLGKLNVCSNAARSRALNAAMKSSRHFCAAAISREWSVIGYSSRPTFCTRGGHPKSLHGGEEDHDGEPAPAQCRGISWREPQPPREGCSLLSWKRRRCPTRPAHPPDRPPPSGRD